MAINSMACDKDGVPELIQCMRYSPCDMAFEVGFFNRENRLFASEDVCPSVELVQNNVSRMQMLEAQNNITNMVLSNYKNIFPTMEKEYGPPAHTKGKEKEARQ